MFFTLNQPKSERPWVFGDALLGNRRGEVFASRIIFLCTNHLTLFPGTSSLKTTKVGCSVQGPRVMLTTSHIAEITLTLTLTSWNPGMTPKRPRSCGLYSAHVVVTIYFPRSSGYYWAAQSSQSTKTNDPGFYKLTSATCDVPVQKLSSFYHSSRERHSRWRWHQSPNGNNITGQCELLVFTRRQKKRHPF